MNCVFGPVPSRRLGQSLGIDPVPLKTCNWNCVYCQLGRSLPLVSERREYVPREEMLAEVKQALAAHQRGEIDWVTFVGSGETTLHSDIGWLIQQVKALTSLPVAVITNGSLLYLAEMRQELSAADAVMPSLDAGNARLYRKINRPHPEASFKRLVEGMAAFHAEYHGKLWVQVMLMKDLNDTHEALEEIAAVLQSIQPDQVHLLLPLRPPAESWVQPADEDGLQRAQMIMGKVAQVVQPNVGGTVTCRADDLETAALGIITRHPMQEEELCSALDRWPPGEVRQALEKLQTDQKVKQVIRHGKHFWSAVGAYYAADAAQAGKQAP